MSQAADVVLRSGRNAVVIPAQHGSVPVAFLERESNAHRGVSQLVGLDLVGTGNSACAALSDDDLGRTRRSFVSDEEQSAPFIRNNSVESESKNLAQLSRNQSTVCIYGSHRLPVFHAWHRPGEVIRFLVVQFQYSDGRRVDIGVPERTVRFEDVRLEPFVDGEVPRHAVQATLRSNLDAGRTGQRSSGVLPVLRHAISRSEKDQVQGPVEALGRERVRRGSIRPVDQQSEHTDRTVPERMMRAATETHTFLAFTQTDGQDLVTIVDLFSIVLD